MPRQCLLHYAIVCQTSLLLHAFSLTDFHNDHSWCCAAVLPMLTPPQILAHDVYQATLLTAALQWYQYWHLTSCFFMFFLLLFAAAPVMAHWTVCDATKADAIPTITASFDCCSSQLSLAVAAVTTCCSAPCCYQFLCHICSPAPMLWYLHW